MDALVGALAEPWVRWWGGQNVGGAVTFWAVGLLAYLTRHPVSFRCATAGPGAWCRIHQAGAFGTGLALVIAAAVVAGSAVFVAALALLLIRVLAGETWPNRAWFIPPSRSLNRWLIRRQIDGRGRVAALGKPVSDAQADNQAPATGPDARKRHHRALAEYAVDRAVDRAATARLRRYPADCEAVSTYCDLVEGTVATHRHLLYQAVGLPLPADTSAEVTTGRRLSAYLAGDRGPDPALPLSWTVFESAQPTQIAGGDHNA